MSDEKKPPENAPDQNVEPAQEEQTSIQSSNKSNPASTPGKTLYAQSSRTADHTISEHTSTNITSSEYTQSELPKRSWTKLFLIGLAGAVVGLVGLVALTLVLEGPEAILGDASNKEQIKAPPSATEIIALEFSGKIETAPVDPDALTQPTGAELPTTAALESRDFDEEAKDFFKDDKPKKIADKKSNEKDPSRKPASVDKSPLKLKFDKGASKVSKNLNKSKVLSYLAKKLDNSCQPKLSPDTKSVRAEMKIAKNGSIANIKVSPSSAESELAKCMRQKLADSKVLKPKGKDTAQITVQFKLK